MSAEHYADMVRQILRRRGTEAASPLRRLERPLVLAAERALRRRRIRQRMVRFGAITSVATVMVLGIGGAGWLFLGGRARLPGAVHDAVSARSVASGQETVLPVGARLTSPEGSELRLGAPDGSDLILEPGSELTVLQSGAVRRYGLRRGAVRMHVAKLHPGERFLVSTDDAEVEVRGTIFRVAVTAGGAPCAGGSITRVTVEEGRVDVRHGGAAVHLSRGERWPAACDALALGRASSPSVSAAAADAPVTAQAVGGRDERPQRTVAGVSRGSGWSARGAARARGRGVLPAEMPVSTAGVSDGEGFGEGSRTPSTGARTPVLGETPELPTEDLAGSLAAKVPATGAPSSGAPSTSSGAPEDVTAPLPKSELAAQNEMYALAIAAKRRHRPHTAIRLLTQFLQRYPTSPLSESARVQRLELLVGTESPEAPRVARDYLQRYPDGFARVDALRVAGAGSP